MDPDWQLLTVTSLLHVCTCACKQLPGNQSFARRISAHEKGGGVMRVGQWAWTGNCFVIQVCYMTLLDYAFHAVFLRSDNYNLHTLKTFFIAPISTLAFHQRTTCSFMLGRLSTCN